MPDLPPADLLAELRSHSVDEVISTLAEEGITLGTPAYYEALVEAGLGWQIAQVKARNLDALRLLALLAAYPEASIIPLARLRLLTGWQDSGLRRPVIPR